MFGLECFGLPVDQAPLPLVVARGLTQGADYSAGQVRSDRQARRISRWNRYGSGVKLIGAEASMMEAVEKFRFKLKGWYARAKKIAELVGEVRKVFLRISTTSTFFLRWKNARYWKRREALV